MSKKPMLTNKDIVSLHEVIKHYDWSVAQRISGFCALPACTYPETMLECVRAGVILSRYFRKFAQIGEHFCSESVAHKWQAAVLKKQCKSSRPNRFLWRSRKLHVTGRGDLSNIASEDPAWNPRKRHPLCWSLDSMCFEITDSSKSHCKVHAKDLYRNWVVERRTSCSKSASMRRNQVPIRLRRWQHLFREQMMT